MGDSTWEPYNGTQSSPYRIVAKVTDNSGIASVEIRSSRNSTWQDMTPIDNSRYIFQLDFLPANGEVYYIRATDNNGHMSETSWRMES